MPCRELFMLNTEQYIQSVLPAGIPTLSLEAGVTQGWTGFSNSISSAIGLNRLEHQLQEQLLQKNLG